MKKVKNSVLNAKIDPKVVMDLSIFKIAGWNNLQPSIQKILEDFLHEPWVVDRNSKKRSIPCDTTLGDTLEEVHVTS